MGKTQSAGNRGEAAVARYLRQKGYTLLESQWRCRFGELDLVARDKTGTICFVEVKLRSGEITACEKIKKAKKLLKLTVDDGRNGRQIVSGIANWYQPEDLIGRKIVFVANLAPAKLCGELSEGMILACDAGDNDVRVLFLDKDVPNGSTIR